MNVQEIRYRKCASHYKLCTKKFTKVLQYTSNNIITISYQYFKEGPFYDFMSKRLFIIFSQSVDTEIVMVRPNINHAYM